MSWETLRPVLLELSSREPNPLCHYPDPRVAGARRTPFHVQLAPWAESVAGALHRSFGEEVVLVVGNFGYPERVWVDPRGRPVTRVEPPLEHFEMADPSVLLVRLRHDLVVASGHDIDTELAVSNQADGPLELRQPRAEVVDPTTGARVGGQPGGARPLVGRGHVIAPRRVATVPLHVGTASSDPRLGYAVPPGGWALRVFVPLSNDRILRAPLLPVEIT